LLGYPYNPGGSTLTACAAASLAADADDLGRAHKRSTDPQWQKELEDEAPRTWRLLLQVDSSDQAAMDWAGGFSTGVLDAQP
jgi:hypothetical protein